MKIKKVDDNPMVIHTKEKAKIHAHEPKAAAPIAGLVLLLLVLVVAMIAVPVIADACYSRWTRYTVHKNKMSCHRYGRITC